MMEEVQRTEEENSIAAGHTPHPVQRRAFGQKASKDARHYNSATVNEVVVVYVGDEEWVFLASGTWSSVHVVDLCRLATI